MPFKKGQSGNPKGRKPGVPNKANRALRESAQEYTAESVAKLVALLRDPGCPHATQLAAACAILDRAHGKPVQAHEGVPEGEPIRIVLTTEADAHG